MLVYQGAIAFKLWTGVEPDVAVMRRALEQVFGVCYTWRVGSTQTLGGSVTARPAFPRQESR